MLAIGTRRWSCSCPVSCLLIRKNPFFRLMILKAYRNRPPMTSGPLPPVPFTAESPSLPAHPNACQSRLHIPRRHALY